MSPYMTNMTEEWRLAGGSDNYLRGEGNVHEACNRFSVKSANI